MNCSSCGAGPTADDPIRSEDGEQMHRSCIARGRKSALNMRASDREVISAANLRINAEMRKAWADPADMTHIQEAQRILNQAVDQLAGAPF